MKKRGIFYILFFILLFAGFLVALSFFVPGFLKPSIPPIGRVQSFRFEDQDGRWFTEEKLKDKVVAVEYFFTTCPGICPRMNNNMKKIYKAFENEDDFLILSHTSDPGTDSAARLKKYADSLGVNTNKWTFLTGRKDSLYHMARHAYKIDDPKNNVADINDDFLHTQFIALVNKKGEVVKIFDALKESEIQSLEQEIRKLLKK